MKSCGPVEIVRHIVFARPQQLDRDAYRFGDPRSLDHIVVAKTPAKAAANAREVKLDVGGSQASCPGHQVDTGLRSLGGGPDFQLSILEVGSAVLRLQWSMGDIGISISSFDHFRGALQCSFDVSVRAK